MLLESSHVPLGSKKLENAMRRIIQKEGYNEEIESLVFSLFQSTKL